MMTRPTKVVPLDSRAATCLICTVAFALLFAGETSAQPTSRTTQTLDYAHGFRIPSAIIGRFIHGGSRAQFLAELKASQADHAEGWYKDEFATLVPALEHVPGPPSGYDKPEDRRTPDESIQAWVYDLNGRPLYDDTPHPLVSPQEHLCTQANGAMDALIAALNDDTPVRSLIPEAGISLDIPLRRCDLALDCIEQIAGTTFYRRTEGRGTAFHNDPQRASAAENVHLWWQQAKGKSQADGLRIQLMLAPRNTTLRDSTEPELYVMLAQLTGPASVIQPLRLLTDGERDNLNSYIVHELMEFDPQYVLIAAFERFRNHQCRSGDYLLLFQYGNKDIHREIGVRAETGQFDPGSWALGDEAENAAKYGRNWAIPFVAAILSKTEMTGGRSFGAPAQSFCAADEAVACFQQLTGKDFSYKKEGSQTDRLAAIARARDWWNAGGKSALAGKIAEDHPTRTDGTDLLWTEENLAAVADRITGNDTAAARTAVASLPKVTNYQVQQALATRLGRETDPAQRLLILQKVDRIGYWLAPTVAALFETDPSLEVRSAAASLLQLQTAQTSFWNRRLETRDEAMTIVRRIADNPVTPPPLVVQAAHILIRNESFQDIPRLQVLAHIESLHSDEVLIKYLDRQNQREQRNAPTLHER